MSSNDPSRSGISTPLDLTSYIVKKEDQFSDGGRFGDVYRCWYNESEGVRKEVAVKAFRFKLTMDEDDAEKQSAKMIAIRRELGIWKRLDHENIVPFLGIAYGFGMRGALSLVSLWMPNGTLHSFLEKNDSLSVPRRLQLLLDIANGLNYLHSFPICPIVHGDLSSNNVLVDANHTAQLVDFGYASLVGRIPEALSYLQMSTKQGTLRWSAPELVSRQQASNRTTKSDIYSFGNISLQVLSGKQPWSEIKEDACVVLSLAVGLNPGRPEHHRISDEHWDFIQQCWLSASKRPSAESMIASIKLFLSSPQPYSTSPSEQYGPIVVPDEPSLDPLDLFLNDGSAGSFGFDQRDAMSSAHYQGTPPNHGLMTTFPDSLTLLSTGSSTDPALFDPLPLPYPPTASILLRRYISPLEPLLLPSGTDVPSNPSSPSDRFYTAPCSPSELASYADIKSMPCSLPMPARFSLSEPLRGLENHRCQWIGENGITCREFITSVNVRAHFCKHHGIKLHMPPTAQSTCASIGCGRSIRGRHFVRHLREVHLRVGRIRLS